MAWSASSANVSSAAKGTTSVAPAIRSWVRSEPILADTESPGPTPSASISAGVANTSIVGSSSAPGTVDVRNRKRFDTWRCPVVPVAMAISTAVVPARSTVETAAEPGVR